MVVATSWWPSSSWIVRMSYPSTSRCVGTPCREGVSRRGLGDVCAQNDFAQHWLDDVGCRWVVTRPIAVPDRCGRWGVKWPGPHLRPVGPITAEPARAIFGCPAPAGSSAAARHNGLSISARHAVQEARTGAQLTMRVTSTTTNVARRRAESPSLADQLTIKDVRCV